MVAQVVGEHCPRPVKCLSLPGRTGHHRHEPRGLCALRPHRRRHCQDRCRVPSRRNWNVTKGQSLCHIHFERVAMGRYIIGIDQSTQGTKALLVDEGGHLIHRADRSHRQIVNDAGWVSHDPVEIAANVLAGRVPWWRRPGSIRPTLLVLASPTSARPPLPGTARRASRCATPWCGSVPAPASCVTSLRRAKAWQSWCVTTTGLVLSPYYPAGKMA